MSKLVSPAIGVITSHYGPRKSPGGIGSTNHKGVDIARGSLVVVAPADGTVVTSTYSAAGRGHYIQIDHGNGVRTLHQHLAVRAVAKGTRVAAGQRIGTMGRTGLVTGVHLHTEVTVGGVLVNPSTWYAQRGVRLATTDTGALPTAPTSSGSTGTLKIGSTGARVTALQNGFRRVFPAYRQKIAVNNRRLIPADGSFGPETDAWVREFQTRTGLTVDGLVGPATTRELAKYGINI